LSHALTLMALSLSHLLHNLFVTAWSEYHQKGHLSLS
jgi:hypothetical protein